MRKLRVLFDADDVAENLCECLVQYLNERYGTTVRVEDVTDWDVSRAFPMLTREQVLAPFEEDALFRRLEPVPGAQEHLERMRKDGHELYMVTASGCRTLPAKMDRIFQLFPWLSWDHVIVTASKSLIRGDVLIDDKPENLLGGEYIGFLFDRPHNRQYPTTRENGPHRVMSWAQAYRAVCRIAADLCGFVSWKDVQDAIMHGWNGRRVTRE